MNQPSSLNRRQFFKISGAAALTGAASQGTAFAADANGKHIVVIGGGVGGATAAKYIKLADKGIKVTVIEKNPVYIRPYGSSEVLNGHTTMQALEVRYDDLKKNYGIDFIFDSVTGLDAAAHKVKLASGAEVSYDKLIVSPGITLKYDAIPGYSEAIANTQAPSGWIPGAQTQLLAEQLKAMPKGGTFVIVAPPNPYRCPPGPYERAGLMAEWLQEHNPTAKVVILDPKDNFVTDTTMQQGWNRLYNYPLPKDYEAKFVEELKKNGVFKEGDGVAQLYERGILKKPDGRSMIEWVRGMEGGRVLKLDVANKTVEAEKGVIKYDVINLIPPMVAGKVAFDLGLTDGTGFCPIDFKSFESKQVPGVYVIGDSSSTPMPKSGFSANTQAKVAAMAAIAALKGQAVATPNWENTCYALAGKEYGFFVADVFDLVEGKITNVSGHRYLPLDASMAKVRLGAVYQQAWLRTFTLDCFV